MGLLDDAIREHLDLKRRRGADATEVEKLEQEAFGPVRRQDVAEAEAPAAAEPGEYDAFADAPHAEPPAAHELDEPASAAEYESFSDEEQDAGQRRLVDPPLDHEEPPAPTGGSVALPPAEDEQVTVAFTVPEPEPAPAPDPDVVAADPEPGEHDELEETPDFLQETPEHDRLWFEQKPPRDFDF